ncbi:hypothetical protein NQK81_02330 [Amycolatopsis roodepoortensis]|uniref:ATP-dependent DNA ligase n=1 Tax=Amycolatopsis roodepoortensis TaxID=700274 RepID=UPI00214C8349|nr:hypothetical protein [Amycolatopsis roodepoortensis]UUV32311.1 hypothetical protein NQK81_02330 [Amycolatopsis roodepoortensis]
MAVLRPPVPPPQAQSTREVPVSRPRREWIYQPKWDGWRALLFAADGVLQSRRDNDLSSRFPEIVHAAAQLGDVVLDGELVALRGGRLDFGALTSTPRTRAAEGITVYYVTGARTGSQGAFGGSGSGLNRSGSAQPCQLCGVRFR